MTPPSCVAMGGVFYPRAGRLARGRRRLVRDRAGRLAAAATHGAVDVGLRRVARQRKSQHAGAVVDANRLQGRAGAGRARGAGRAGGGQHAARLERVQQRLGREPRERQRGDVRARAARRSPSGGAPGTAAPAPPASSRSRSGADRLGAAGVERSPAPARPPARTRRSPAGSRSPPRSPRSWPPPTQSGSRRAPGRTQSAPAPRGPCSLWAESARLSAPSARGAQAQQAERLHGVDVQVRAASAIGRRAGGRSRRSAAGCRSRSAPA